MIQIISCLLRAFNPSTIAVVNKKAWFTSLWGKTAQPRSFLINSRKIFKEKKHFVICTQKTFCSNFRSNYPKSFRLKMFAATTILGHFLWCWNWFLTQNVMVDKWKPYFISTRSATLSPLTFSILGNSLFPKMQNKLHSKYLKSYFATCTSPDLNSVWIRVPKCLLLQGPNFSGMTALPHPLWLVKNGNTSIANIANIVIVDF